MSKRVAIASIICLVIGGITLPGGIFLGNSIKNMTYRSIDEGLLGIKEEGIPLVESMIKQYGVAESLLQIKNVGPSSIEKIIYKIGSAIALSTIQEVATPTIEEMLYQIGPAQAFEIIREKGIEASKPVVNATIFMNQVYNIESIGMGLEATVESLFFDRTDIGGTSFSDLVSILSYPPIKGMSEWFGENLNFTVRDTSNNDVWGGVKRLKYGINVTGWWGNRLPGIFEDTYRRVGESDWPPENYGDAANTIDTYQDRGFGVLEILDLVEGANQTQINELVGPNGYNFTEPFVEYEYMGTNYTKLEILYFYYTDYFVNEVFGMVIEKFNQEPPPSNPLWTNYPQYRPRDWNSNNTSYLDIAYYSFIEQWAKCLSYDFGTDLHRSEPSIPEGTYGLEPGGPGNSSGIPMQAALQLWNASNQYSFVNFTGITMWYEAHTNETSKNVLLNEFSQYSGYPYENDTYGESDWGFNETDVDLLLDWLWGSGGGWSHGSFSEYLLPKLIIGNYGVTITELASQVFLEQWANGTAMGMDLYPEGIDFNAIIKELPPGTTGLEVGIPTPLNFSYEESVRLWNSSHQFSLTNLVGIELWFEANSSVTDKTILLNEYEFLNQKILDLLLEWLWGPEGFNKNLLPVLIQSPKPYGYNQTIEELAEQTLYEQWSNGTSLGMELYSDGIDFSSIVDGIPSNTVGFEPGIPMSLNLTHETCRALWNENNSKSFLNMFEGIPLWVKAYTNNDTKQDLMEEFSLSLSQMDLLLNWLWNEEEFSDKIVPILIESELGYGIPLEELSFHILLEQWANGTVMNKKLYTQGFPLPLGEKEIYGFEVGLPTPTNISLESALSLWNESSDHSLVTKSGLDKWLRTLDGDNESKAELLAENDLEEEGMDQILDWLSEFQQNVMPQLAQYQYTLPTDSVSLANSFQIGGLVIGGISTGLGVAGVSLNYLVKRKIE